MRKVNSMRATVLAAIVVALLPALAGGETPARSLILFIGDGMGPEIVSIAKIYSENVLGVGLSMVGLANSGVSGFVTTHSATRLVTDSAASGTALATGQKTANGVVGMSPEGTALENLFESALGEGKAVGVVTTTSITDATPASFLAHARTREDEVGIAGQIIESPATVIMGGGRVFFLPPAEGRRADGRNLLEEARGKGFDVVLDRDGLEAAGGRRLLGLFAAEDLPYERQRVGHEIPSLAEMVVRALRLLTADPDGFILVVEGGRIDHAEHENRLPDALAEMLEFDAAVGHALEYQQSDSTLVVIVTADHDTGGPAITAGYTSYPVLSEISRVVEDDCPFIKWVSGNHTGTMVPIFAKGPGERLFSGIMDNTDVHHRMVRALALEGVGATTE